MWKFTPYLECILGDGIILIPAGPRLPVLRVQAVSEHVDVEEDVLLVRKIRLAEMHHQLPEDVRRAADKRHCEEDEQEDRFNQGSKKLLEQVNKTLSVRGAGVDL